MPEPTIIPTGLSRPMRLRIDSSRLAAIQEALTVAAASIPDCEACTRHDGEGATHHDQCARRRLWHNMANRLRAIAQHTAPPVPGVSFDPQACRAWLTTPDSSFDVDSDMPLDVATVASLLDDLQHGPDGQPHTPVWQLIPPVEAVTLWRTSDGDTVDGGLITIDLRLDGQRIRLATLHQDGTDLAATHHTGADALVTALTFIAELVNDAVADHVEATGVPHLDTSPAATR